MVPRSGATFTQIQLASRSPCDYDAPPITLSWSAPRVVQGIPQHDPLQVPAGEVESRILHLWYYPSSSSTPSAFSKQKPSRKKITGLMASLSHHLIPLSHRPEAPKGVLIVITPFLPQSSKSQALMP